MGRTSLFGRDETVFFATQIGLYTFDHKAQRLQPVTEFGAYFNENSVTHFIPLSENRYWAASGGNMGELTRGTNGQWAWDTIPFKRLPPTSVRDVLVTPEDIVWIATDDGLFRYDPAVPKDYAAEYFTLIRKVVMAGDSLLAVRPTHPPVLPATTNDIQFRFVAPFFEVPEKLRYSWKLDGYDEAWSAWEKRNEKEYTNLPGGEYVFRVKARNVYGHESVVAEYRFSVQKPWYLTAWAFGLFALALCVLIWGVVQIRVRRLLKAKARLEVLVKERTAEIEAQKTQIEAEKRETEIQKERAEKSERVKKRFFANMTHELRTPLTLILGPVQQMLGQPASPAHRNQLSLVQRNGQKLLRLINQLLDISKIESERMELRPVRRDVRALVRDVAGHFEAAAAAKALAFEVEVGERMEADFDPEKLEKMLFNLLSNAVKFTEKGKISVAARVRAENGEDIEIEVKDSGPGIPESAQPHVFDRFYQSENKIGQAGTGIGLALCKELVELHGGEIELKSIVGVGSSFVLRWPRFQEISGEVESDTSTAHTTTEKAELYLVPEGQPMAPEARKPDSDNLLAEQARNVILLVEDNQDVRTYIHSCIPPEYEVVHAENGKIGLEQATQWVPDLVISDIMMPEMDGYELLQHLKSQPSTSHIPVILLTSKAEEESKHTGLEQGAEAYLTKPFDPAELQIRIRKLIETRQHLREKYRGEVLLAPQKVEATSTEEAFLLNTKRIIYDHLADESFSVEQLAAEAGMSRVQFNRKFKALTAQTPNKFIRKYRLETATDLLEQHAGTIAEIAFQVGFSSAAYFSKCYMDEYGVSPSKVRQKTAKKV
ncbi:MAG: hybrid sensor histidine kinase/response regulator transcription factor [Bacteroidota bacterium]